MFSSLFQYPTLYGEFKNESVLWNLSFISSPLCILRIDKICFIPMKLPNIRLEVMKTIESLQIRDKRIIHALVDVIQKKKFERLMNNMVLAAIRAIEASGVRDQKVIHALQKKTRSRYRSYRRAARKALQTLGGGSQNSNDAENLLR